MILKWKGGVLLTFVCGGMENALKWNFFGTSRPRLNSEDSYEGGKKIS